MLKKITLALIFVTWPISLFLANTHVNFLNYFTPAILIGLSFFHPIPLLLTPAVQPKLALFPLLFIIINFKRKNVKYVVLALALLLLFFKSFFGQTVFVKDYQREQLVLQNTQLYPSTFMARLFQNKLRIPLNKITNNFFALIDPNNYFFGFAPRQITVDNQNLKKFPFLSLPFLLIGLFNIFKNKNHKFIISAIVACIINLSILTNFDRNDFILWLPISSIIAHGIEVFDEKFKEKSKIYYMVFIIFAISEILRIIVQFNK